MSRRLITLLIALSLGTHLGCKPRSTSALRVAHLERRTLAPGVEALEARVSRGDEEIATLYAVYADLQHVRPRLSINAEQAPLFSLHPTALVVANAGFFTEERRATGLLMSDGKRLSAFVPRGGAAGSGVLVIEDQQVRLLERDAIKAPERLEKAQFALQAGPRIIENDGTNGIRSDDGERARRTVIGADTKGRLALATIRGGTTTGPTLFEVQQILGRVGLGSTKAKDLAFRLALNLDGGPSSGFYVRHREHGLNLPEQASIHSVLRLEPRP